MQCAASRSVDFGSRADGALLRLFLLLHQGSEEQRETQAALLGTLRPHWFSFPGAFHALSAATGSCLFGLPCSVCGVLVYYNGQKQRQMGYRDLIQLCNRPVMEFHSSNNLSVIFYPSASPALSSPS